MSRHIGDRPDGDPAAEELVARHQRTIEELDKVYARLKDELIPRTAGLVATISPALIPWRQVIAGKVDQTQQHLWDLDQRLGLLQRSGPLPVRLWRTASEWTRVRSSVGSVAGDLGVTNREIHLRWRGIAAETYAAVIPAHAGAAGRLATVADTVSYALNWAAAAIAQMYAAVLGLLVGFIGAALIALATAATIVGAVAGIVALLVLTGTVLTLVSSAIVAGMQAVGTAQTWLTEMISEMADTTAFPGGRWPAARPEWFLDATTADGDPSDWSVR
jgi:hypothetical protein